MKERDGEGAKLRFRLVGLPPAALDLFEPNSRILRGEGDTVDATTRYVFATAMGGRLFFGSMGAHSAAELALIFNPNTQDRMIHTAEELAGALRASAAKPLPMLWLWIAEDLEEEARRSSGRSSRGTSGDPVE